MTREEIEEYRERMDSSEECSVCDGTGYRGPGTEMVSTDPMHQPMGVYPCGYCRGGKTAPIDDCIYHRGDLQKFIDHIDAIEAEVQRLNTLARISTEHYEGTVGNLQFDSSLWKDRAEKAEAEKKELIEGLRPFAEGWQVYHRTSFKQDIEHSAFKKAHELIERIGGKE